MVGMRKKNKSSLSLLQMAPCLLAIIIDNLGFGLVYPIMAGLFTTQTTLFSSTSHDAANFYLGLSYLLYPLFMFFGASMLGHLSDMFGRKKIILLCMGGIAVSFLFMGLGVSLSSLFLILLGRALSGLFAGSQPIVQASIVDQSTPQNKTFNMSLIGLTLSIGLILGPIFGGVLSDASIGRSFNFSTPFYLAALLSVICVLWIAAAFKETFSLARKKSFNVLEPILIFVKAFKSARLRLLSLIFFSMQIGFSLFFTLGLIYLKKSFDYPNWELGAFNGWIGVGFTFGMFFIARRVARKYSAESISVYAMLVTAIGQLFFFLPLSSFWVWALALPIAASDMLAYTTMLTSFSNVADKRSQGWVMGIAIATMAVAWVVSGFGSNLLDVMGANHIIGIGGALLALASVLMFFYTRKYAAAFKPAR